MTTKRIRTDEDRRIRREREQLRRDRWKRVRQIHRQFRDGTLPLTPEIVTELATLLDQLLGWILDPGGEFAPPVLHDDAEYLWRIAERAKQTVVLCPRCRRAVIVMDSIEGHDDPIQYLHGPCLPCCEKHGSHSE